MKIVYSVPHRGLYQIRGTHTPESIDDLVHRIREHAKAYPFEHPRMRDGSKFGVKVTSFGSWGWWSDEAGFRYIAKHPTTKQPWPPIDGELLTHVLPFLYMADHAARQAEPKHSPATWHVQPGPSMWSGTIDTCLVNLYAADAILGWHTDKTEQDKESPIITMSIGASARFEIKLDDEIHRMTLHSGDGVVMAGASRNAEHRIVKILSPAELASENQVDLFAGPKVETPIHNPLSNGTRISITWRRTGLGSPT